MKNLKGVNLVPVILFCVVFLAYCLYFVKVINTNERLEPNSIAKNVKRVMDEKEAESAAQNLLKEPVTRYVNYTWLNVRKEASLSSPMVEKVVKNDAIQVLGYPTASWAYIQTASGTIGYVARQYLSDRPVIQAPDPVPVIEAPKTVTPPPEVVTPEAQMVIYDLPIITYHHISDQVENYSRNLVLPEINFNAQLDYLVSHGMSTSTFYDLQDVVDGKKPTPEKSVILTFNGGYDDAYVAAQHLNGKGMKGVFFITTDKIGTTGYLDWRQVKKMRSWGMEIGSQGVNGANLLREADFFAKDELVRSKAVIEKELGETIISFAYPDGGYSGKVMVMAEKAGYRFARTDNSGSRYSNRQFYFLPTLRVFFPAGARQFQVWLE